MVSIRSVRVRINANVIAKAVAVPITSCCMVPSRIFPASASNKSADASQPNLNSTKTSTTAVDNTSTQGTNSTSGLTSITDVKGILEVLQWLTPQGFKHRVRLQ